jgi:FkbM family methyltransferase
MKRLWPESTIHSFEPVPHIFQQLTDNTSHLSNAYRYNYALSDKNETHTMHISSGRSDACSSLLQPCEELMTSPHITFESTVEVETITLDTWADKHAINHIDFLWLDLQGAELKALRGAESILKTVSVIQVEINKTERYKGAVLYPELKEWLLSQGFQVDTETWFKTTWGDALFVKNS